MSDAMDRRVIPSTLDTVFEFDYTVQAEDMRGLYEKAKRDQWNASRDIAWATPEPSDGRVLADELVDIHGSPLWERLSEKDRVELNRRITAWRLSVLVYGEQGAMLACSQLVDTVAGADAKFFQATQVMDEARHNEVLERYIQHRLGGLHYPMPENERFLFDAILTDSRWYIKTIALQLVAETFAVSMFRMMQECAVDPLLGEVCGRILQDESRHMGFGMLALPAIVKEASAAGARGDGGLHLHRGGEGPHRILPHRRRTATWASRPRRSPRSRPTGGAWRRGTTTRVFRKHFRREMHAAMVTNLARIGLLTERVRPRLAALGITLPAV